MQEKPRLKWRPQARAELLKIAAELTVVSPVCVQEWKDEIEARVEQLPADPELYKPSIRVRGMRELLVQNNTIVFYRATAKLVEIVSVFRARRKEFAPGEGPL